ncbi:MAG: tetratricopeptide repeat protein [Bacteroidales bacterium]|nr:tetratricopeptide repeat protein [Bacteroidales bacterium]
MNDNFDQYSEEEINDLKSKFFQMKSNGKNIYFDVDEYEGLINHFFESEDTENIETLLSYALDQHPGKYEFLLKKAQLFAIYGNDEQGLQILDKLSSLGTDPDYYMIRGTLLSNLQKYREAIEEYTKALNQGQDLEDVYTNIAFEYENLEQFDKAIEYLSKSLKINPDNEATLNEVGICFEMNNQSKDALVYFNHFIDLYPYSRAAWFNLAIAHNSLGNNTKAIDAYEYSLAIDENQPSALFNIANIYAGMGKHKQAISFYSETLSKESPDAITYYYMGESYEKLDNYDEALICYDKSYQVNQSFHESIIGSARCYFIIGSEEKAYAHIKKAIDLEEPFPLFWSIRSLKLDESGYFTLARYTLIQLIKKFPKEPIYIINLAVLFSSHDMNHAIQVLNDSLLQFTESNERALILYFKGLYQMQNGKIKHGLKNFEKAILLNKEEFQNPLIQVELANFSHPDLKALISNYNL